MRLVLPDAAYISLAGSVRALFQKNTLIDRLSGYATQARADNAAGGLAVATRNQCGRTFSVKNRLASLKTRPVDVGNI
jgi:hypothetical protein